MHVSGSIWAEKAILWVKSRLVGRDRGHFAKNGDFFAIFGPFWLKRGAFQGGVRLHNFLCELCAAEETPPIKKSKA